MDLTSIITTCAKGGWHETDSYFDFRSLIVDEKVKVLLLPECFIKMYADHFQFSKEEAELRISETPLHKKDRAKIGVGEAEEEELAQTQGEI